MTDWRKKENALDAKKTSQGAIAQLGERLPCTQEVVGSTPIGSTIRLDKNPDRFLPRSWQADKKGASITVVE